MQQDCLRPTALRVRGCLRRWFVIASLAVGVVAVGVAAAAQPVRKAGRRAERDGVTATRSEQKWFRQKWADLARDDVPGRHMLLDLAREYGMWKSMRKLADEILALDPDHAEAHRHLGHVRHGGKWLTGDEAEAKGLVPFNYTFPAGYPTPKRDRLLFPIYLKKSDHKKHEKRQDWAHAWVHRKKPLMIRSNMPKERIEALAEVFDVFADQITRFLGYRLSSNYEINIFRSKEEYHTLGGGPRGTGGFYSPHHRKLFFYDDPYDQIGTQRVLFHEGAHMIVHLTCKNKDFWHPICVSEGLAEYFAAARWDYYKQKFTFGHPLNDRIKSFQAMLKRGTQKPLRDLVLHPRSGFGGREYAQAWALITYLSDAQIGNSSKLLGKYLKRLYTRNKYKMLPDSHPKKIAAMTKIFEKTFFNPRNGTTWEEFEAKFHDYVKKMKLEIGAPDFARRYRKRAGLSQ